MKNDITIDDCWNKIGIWRKEGNACPQLDHYIHCRNCEHFINSGLRLLDRELPDDYIHENSLTYSHSSQLTSKQDISCLIFRLGTEWYAIKTAILNEIHALAEVHSIPHNKQAALEGLVCINGEMEICISLAQLVTGSSPKEIHQRIKSRLVLISLDSGTYAFKACEVLGIYPINANILKPPPACVMQARHKITESVFSYKNKSIGLINKSHLDMIFVEAIA